MRRTICSATIVIVTTIITAGNSHGVGVANAAARAHPAQTKTATPAAGDACSLLTTQDAAAALGEKCYPCRWTEPTAGRSPPPPRRCRPSANPNAIMSPQDR